jgi:hypothetical protein
MNIFDKVRELQAAICEQYGVEAHIGISIHDHTNPVMTKCLAEYIANEIANQVGDADIREHRHGKGETCQWVHLDTRKNFSVNVFYPE